MDYEKYSTTAKRASEQFEAGNYQEALKSFLELTSSNLPDLDKVMMWLNIATVHDKLKRPDEALRAYDRAISLETKHNRFFAFEKKAAYLFELGRHVESLRLYEMISRRPDLNASDRERIAYNIRETQSRIRP